MVEGVARDEPADPGVESLAWSGGFGGESRIRPDRRSIIAKMDDSFMCRAADLQVHLPGGTISLGSG